MKSNELNRHAVLVATTTAPAALAVAATVQDGREPPTRFLQSKTLRKTHPLKLLLLAAVACGALTPAVRAATYAWGPGLSGTWATGGNWTPSGPPGLTDTADFSGAGFHDVDMGGSTPFSIDAITFGGGAADYYAIGDSSNVGPFGSWNAVTVTTSITKNGPSTAFFAGTSIVTPLLDMNAGYLSIADTNLFAATTVNVNGGILCAGAITPGATISAGNWNVYGGRLKTQGTLWGTVTVFGPGGTAPGCSVGTATIQGDLVFKPGSSSTFELGTPNIVGGGVNDLFNVNGNLTLNGSLDVVAQPGFGPGVYRLFNYTGTLSGPLPTLGTMPPGYNYLIDAATAGQVNLLCTTHGCLAPPSGMVAWWPLDEPTGAVIFADLSGNGNAAFVQSGGPVGSLNSPLAVPAGKVAGAQSFYNPITRGRAFNAPSLNFGAGSFSVDCWVNPVPVGPTLRAPIVDKLDVTPLTTFGYAVGILNNRVELRVGNGTLQTLQSVNSVSSGAWNFIAVSVDRGANTVTFHVNGTTEAPQPLSLTGSFDSAVDLLIGGTFDVNAPYGELTLDEVELFNRTLATSEMTALWNADSAGKCKPAVCACPTNNLIMNGSFEIGNAYPFPVGFAEDLYNLDTSMTGWTVGAVGGSSINRCYNGASGCVASDGNFFLDLSGPYDSAPYGAVTQIVSTVVGQCYKATFDLGVKTDSLPILSGPMSVLVTAGATSQTYTHNPPIIPGITVWSNYCFLFTATSTTTAFTIQGLFTLINRGFVGLDNVKMVCWCDCANCDATNCDVAIVCPPNVVTNSCTNGTPVFYSMPAATSTCGAPVTVNCVPPSGSPFPLGVTPVMCIATDPQGHAAGCSFTVTITPPAGGCPCLCPTNNLIVNGSFEDGPFTNTSGGGQQIFPAPAPQPMTGWTVGIDEIARLANGNTWGITASQGTNCLDLTGYTDAAPHGAVTQTVATAIGQCYTLTFDLGVLLPLPGGPISVKVTAGNTWRVFTHNPTGPPGTAWGSYSFAFTAASASTVIAFEGVGGRNFIGLDNLALVCSCACTTNTCLECPPQELAVSGCPPLVPDFSTYSFGCANGGSVGPLIFSQSLPAGTPLPTGTTVVNVNVSDTHDHSLSCPVALKALLSRGCCLCATNNLIVNGSFEDPPFSTADCQQLPSGSTLMPGWTVSIDEIARCRFAPPYNIAPSQGLLFVDLTGFSDAPPHGAVTQTVPTTIGQCYRLTFDLGVNLDWPGLLDGPITVKVTAAGAITQFYTYNPSGSGTVWSNHVFLFTASGASTAITIEGVSGKNFIGLDNVALVCSCDCPTPCHDCSYPLTGTLDGTNIVISWSAAATGLVLRETAEFLGSGTVWKTVTNIPTTAEGSNSVKLPAPYRMRFYRLEQTQ